MTTKEWLSRGRGIRERISELERERQRTFELASSTTGAVAHEERVQSGGGNSLERKILKYTEISVEIDREKEDLLEVLKEINSAICSVSDITLRRLLSMRYIEFMTWEKIAEKMNYGYRNVLKLHGKALLVVDKILQEKSRVV